MEENKNLENENDNLVEVINEEVKDEANNIVTNNSPNHNLDPKSTSKLISFIYAVIFISILIWVYFYVTQNKDILNKTDWNIENQDWENINLNSENEKDLENWENINTNLDNEKDLDNWEVKNNTENVDTSKNNGLQENSIDNNKDDTTTISSWTIEKSEEVIIKDFEKELDSLFNVIDENAK